METDLTVAYCRVSSYDQKEDLKRQAEKLERYCARKGWRDELIKTGARGLPKEGAEAAFGDDPERRVKRVVLTHKDRLLRFGADLVFALCETRNVEVVVMNQGEEASFEEELVQDVLEIIAVFSARPLLCTALAPIGNESWWNRARVLSECKPW